MAVRFLHLSKEQRRMWLLGTQFRLAQWRYAGSLTLATALYGDTSANEDNSFRNHIRYSKRDFP